MIEERDGIVWWQCETCLTIGEFFDRESAEFHMFRYGHRPVPVDGCSAINQLRETLLGLRRLCA